MQEIRTVYHCQQQSFVRNSPARLFIMPCDLALVTSFRNLHSLLGKKLTRKSNTHNFFLSLFIKKSYFNLFNGLVFILLDTRYTPGFFHLAADFFTIRSDQDVDETGFRGNLRKKEGKMNENVRDWKQIMDLINVRHKKVGNS